MSEVQSVIETRGPQMFPTLGPAEIERLRRFGEVRTWPAGAMVVQVGEVSPGLIVVLAGAVSITQHDERGGRRLIVTHHPGAFMGELAQLSGRPSLVDVHADTDLEGLVIPTGRLRSLFVGEAELGERIMRALILRRVGLLETGAGGPVIIGSADDPDVRRLQGFLGRNGHPQQTLDPAVDAEARALVERFHIAPADLPMVLCPSGDLLRNPTESQLARCIGLVAPLDPERVYDVAVIGAGPAGLATAVYAGSEGLSVLVLDCRAFGGQAGASARIENYLGFPTGISGMALMARAYNQAQKFGVDLAIPDEAASLSQDREGLYNIALANAERTRARAVVLASGARYRRLDVARLEEFEAASVHYWASPLEGRLCAGQDVVLVGAGNSAGQAVVYLASQVNKVRLLARGAGLEASMSRYLVDRIEALPNVEVITGAEVCRLEGADGFLERVAWTDRRTGAQAEVDCRHLFLFIGAEPNTDWLMGAGVALDPKGFIRTGPDVAPGRQALETSLDGVFAIGDVRLGSVKRVAASVGEGAQVVATLHQHLAALGVEASVAQPTAAREPQPA